jgi:hypothetical protein
VAEGTISGELKSKNKHVGGCEVGQPRGEREQAIPEGERVLVL